MKYQSDKGGNIASAHAAADTPSLRDIVFNELGDLVTKHPEEVNFALNSSGTDVGKSTDPATLVNAIYNDARKNPRMLRNLSYLMLNKNGINTYQHDFGHMASGINEGLKSITIPNQPRYHNAGAGIGDIIGGVMQGVTQLGGQAMQMVQQKRDPGAKDREAMLALVQQKQQNKHDEKLGATQSSSKTLMIVAGAAVVLTVIVVGAILLSSRSGGNNNSGGGTGTGTVAK
jgi:hypothetical protein